MGSNVCQSYRRQTVSTQCPVSTLSLSLPASHPRPVTTGLPWPLVSGRTGRWSQYTCTASASRHQPRPAQPDTFLLSLFTRPLSLSDGNLKSRKMLSPPAVTATAVKTKGSKNTSKILQTHSEYKERKERNK